MKWDGMDYSDYEDEESSDEEEKSLCAAMEKIRDSAFDNLEETVDEQIHQPL